MKRRIRRKKAMRRLIEEIKFTLGLGLATFGLFGGLFMSWLVFGY